jgi:hypothetical protein
MIAPKSTRREKHFEAIGVNGITVRNYDTDWFRAFRAQRRAFLQQTSPYAQIVETHLHHHGSLEDQAWIHAAWPDQMCPHCRPDMSAFFNGLGELIPSLGVEFRERVKGMFQNAFKEHRGET